MWVKQFFVFLLAVAIQLAIVNNINLGSYINPMFYLLFLIKIPLNTPRWLLLVLGFILGMAIDIFQNSPGINASATVAAAFARPYIFNLLTSRQDFDPGTSPSVANFGLGWYVSFAALLVFIHHGVLFILEGFGFQFFAQMLLRITISSVFTLLLLLLTEYLAYRPKN